MMNIATCMAIALLSTSLNSGYAEENNAAGKNLSAAEATPENNADVPFRKDTDTYYLDSENGDDSNDGKSRRSAWKSLYKIGKLKLHPGDKVLLKRGCEFNEMFLINESSGSEKQRIVISTYGKGEKPKIVAPDNSKQGVQIRNCEYITIEDLDIKNHGSNPDLRERMGLNIHLDDYGEAYGIEIKGIDVHDVNGVLWKREGAGSAIGFTIKNVNGLNRFNGVLIEGCTIRRCVRNGITFGGNFKRDKWYPHMNVVIRENLLEEVPGDGILVGQCDGALVEYNVMRDCPDAWGGRHNAAAGMWPWSSDNTIIQFNEVSGQKSTWDGQGFDADYNNLWTTIRYNYSHDNYGGFLLICDEGASHKTYSAGNVGARIYGNVSYNDGIRPYPRPKDNKWYTPSIHISGPAEDCEVYNNVIYRCKRAEGLPEQDVRFVHSNSWWGTAKSVNIKSNIFCSEVSESNFETESNEGTYYLGNWYMGISKEAMNSSKDPDPKNDHQGFREMLSKNKDVREALKSGLLRKVKTKTAIMVTVDKKKIDKLFNNK